MKHRFTAWLSGLLLVFAFTFSAFGQTQAVTRFDRRVTPPSPQATQLGIFGSFPPDLNTGAVKTTIPLLEVQSRQLSLSVALNYHYTGLQVTEVPSWLGLGWTLSAGGVITRTVQGLPDELGSNRGYLNGGWAEVLRLSTSQDGRLKVGHVPADQDWSPTAKEGYYSQISNGYYDSEPDAYNVSTPFYSGKLFIAANGVITCSPHTDVQFSGSPAQGQWTAVTGNGTRYEFSTWTEGIRPIDVQAPGAITATTAWYLSRITSADGQDWIDLQYGRSESPNAVSEVVAVTREAFSNLPQSQTNCNRNLYTYFSVPGAFGSSFGAASSLVTSVWLTGITTPTTSVEFVSDFLRNDVDTDAGDRPARRLVGVLSRDVQSQQIKTRYDLRYSYFNDGNSDAKTKRLRLDQVQQVGKPPYVFTYNTAVAMPSRESFARDHWGYYNGKTANDQAPIQTLLPRLPAVYSAYRSPAGRSGNDGANRTPDSTFAKAGALRRVRYPTGGWTQFTYEPNTVLVPCDYATATANQFGGVMLAGQSIESYGADVNGGSFIMTPWEQRYANAHNTVTVNIDGQLPPGGRMAYNVNATEIHARRWFTVNDIRYGGSLTGQKDARGHCLPLEGGVNTYLYQLDPDSLYLIRLCRVTYDVVSTSTTSNCIMRINKASADSLRGARFRPGYYYVVAEVNSNNPTVRASIAFDLAFDVVPNPIGPSCRLPLQVGGIRLQKMVDRAGTGDTITKTYRYRQSLSAGGASSGELFFQPEYAYWRPCGEIVVSAADVGKTNWLDAGFHVGYSRVEVETEGRQGGTTIYYYANDRNHGTNCRSLVTKVEELNQTGALVKQTTNIYDYERIASSPGFRLTKEYTMEGVLGGSSSAPGVPIVMASYYWFANRSYTSYWPKLALTTEQVFSSGATARSRQDTTAYSYLAFGPGQTTQPTRVVKYLDRRRKLITRTQYAGQYIDAALPGSAPAVGLTGLVQRNMVSVPVEHQTWLRTGVDSVVLSGDVTHFANLRPARIFALAPSVPIPAASFLPSKIQVGVFQQDARYIERVAFPLYSALGSLLQQRVAQAPPSSYLWGHAESKLIAEAQNASYSQIAFTSFEPDANGSWLYEEDRVVNAAFTGSKGYQLDGTTVGALQRPGLPAGEYELVLWAHGTNVPQLTGIPSKPFELLATAGPWHQYRYRLSAAATATLQLNAAPNQLIWIDEVRLAPVGTRLTSYTYDPLVGMTSQTDPSGRTTTYEYDAVGRLVRTRDELGRILSQQQYHYAGQ